MTFTPAYPADLDLANLVRPAGNLLMKLLRLLHWLLLLLDLLRGSNRPDAEDPDKPAEDLSYVQGEFFQSQAGLW